MKPNRVYGVDFSGAKNAGRKIWIAGGVVEGELLHFEMCKPAAKLPDSGAQIGLALAALRTFILQRGPCVVGLDFPFGLPNPLVAEDRWEDFMQAFAERYPEAGSFKQTCTDTAMASTGRKELRRDTDVRAETPFSPYNLRIYRQTFYGIRDVLAPLVCSGRVSVLPMQPAIPGRAWLLEICPASTLKEMGLYQTYKNTKSAAVRDAILSSLKHDGCAVVPEQVRCEILKDRDGDALDSVIAAVATVRALRGSLDCAGEGARSRVEGFVYV